jgi:hypothetical protein
LLSLGYINEKLIHQAQPRRKQPDPTNLDRD